MERSLERSLELNNNRKYEWKVNELWIKEKLLFQHNINCLNESQQ